MFRAQFICNSLKSMISAFVNLNNHKRKIFSYLTKRLVKSHQ